MHDPFPSKFKLEYPNLPRDLLVIVMEVAKEIGMKSVAIVGGAVRDKLLEDSNSDYKQKSKDLDLLVEIDP